LGWIVNQTERRERTCIGVSSPFLVTVFSRKTTLLTGRREYVFATHSVAVLQIASIRQSKPYPKQKGPARPRNRRKKHVTARSKNKTSASVWKFNSIRVFRAEALVRLF
jgi:hypothetical protein